LVAPAVVPAANRHKEPGLIGNPLSIRKSVAASGRSSICVVVGLLGGLGVAIAPLLNLPTQNGKFLPVLSLTPLETDLRLIATEFTDIELTDIELTDI
jgi:hypothetical protein